MVRLMVLLEHPSHLDRVESEALLRAWAAELADAASARRVALSPLSGASRRWPHDWDWLVELEYAEADEIARVMCGDACAALLGDLRLLGMRPAVTVAHDATRLAT